MCVACEVEEALEKDYMMCLQELDDLAFECQTFSQIHTNQHDSKYSSMKTSFKKILDSFHHTHTH